MASIQEVAAVAGLSTATVSRVFNKSGNVDEGTRARVLSAAQTLGYSPRSTARRDAVGILIEDLAALRSGGYTGFILASLIEELSRRGLRVEIIRAVDLPLVHPCFYSGFVSALYRSESLQELALLKGARLAAVNEAPDDVPLVRSNEAQGMELAVARLAERGHRRIELFLPAGATRAGHERASGFRAALKRRGLPTDGVVFDSFEEIRVVRGGATAFVAAGEEAGLALHRAIRQAGLRVPDEVSLVAMEHSGVSDKLDPPHTTLVQNFKELARRAVALAVGAAPDNPEPVPYGFIERSTIREVR